MSGESFVDSEFKRMKKNAEENLQPVPLRYLKDGDEFFVEVEGMNPLFLCKKIKGGWIDYEGDFRKETSVVSSQGDEK